MKWRIIADSSCDIFKMDEGATSVSPEELYFSTVPFVITVDGRDFVDDENIDVNELVAAMAQSTRSYTSCPSPESWMREFGEEGDVFAVTISSNLSGSYNSACTAREMILEKNPDCIIVIDSDKYKVEDLDTKLEDHVADETRYMCMSRPVSPIRSIPKRQILSDPLNMFV